jgi:hypothetical protein
MPAEYLACVVSETKRGRTKTAAQKICASAYYKKHGMTPVDAERRERKKEAMAMTKKQPDDVLKFFAPFYKVAGDGVDCVVEGYMTTPSLDSQEDEVVLQASFDAVDEWKKWGNIREMHGPSAAGVALSVEKHVGKGVYLVAEVVDPVAKEKCRKGVYKGFSIGGKVIERKGKQIIKYRMTEVSLVDRPANPDCLLMVAKYDDAPKGATEGDAMVETKEVTPAEAPAVSAPETVATPPPVPETVAKAEHEQMKSEYEKSQARVLELEKAVTASKARNDELEKMVTEYKKEEELKKMLAKAIAELQPEIKKKYEEVPVVDQKKLVEDAVKKMSMGEITSALLKAKEDR